MLVCIVWAPHTIIVFGICTDRLVSGVLVLLMIATVILLIHSMTGTALIIFILIHSFSDHFNCFGSAISVAPIVLTV